MHRRAISIYAYSLCALLLLGLSSPGTVTAAEPGTRFGEPEPLGNGDVRTFVSSGSDGNISAIGVVFSAGLLDGLPERKNDTGRCFDVDGDREFDARHECMGD